MSSIKQTVKALMDGFSKYDPVNVEYGKDQVVGFPNDINGCDLVIYVKKDEITLTYGYHHAYFEASDVNSCLIHGEKLLSGEYASVEYFQEGNNLCGGARPSNICVFNTVEDVVNCYAMGVETVARGLYEIIKRSPVNVRAISFDNKVNDILSLSYDGTNFSITRLK